MNLLQTKREEVNTVQDWLCDKVHSIYFNVSVLIIIFQEDKNATNVTPRDNPGAAWCTPAPP